jgi:thiol-disulfide isomerase/thioredoxin
MLKLSSFSAYLCCIVLISACSFNKFDSEITGYINDENTNTQVWITDIGNKKTYDSTSVINNKFKLSIKNIKEGFYNIQFSNSTREGNITGWRHFALVYLQKEKTYHFFTEDKKSILKGNYKVRSNSIEQIKLEEYRKFVRNYTDSLKNEKERISILIDNSPIDEMYYKYSDSLRVTEALLSINSYTSTHTFLRTNKNTIIIPYLINDMYDLFENYQLYKTYLDNLDDYSKKHSETKKAYKKLETARKLHLGGKLPSFYGKDTSGNTVDYNFSDKKLVLVDFWASWCNPCRELNPKLKEIYQKYRHQGFDIISISMDEDLEKWKKAAMEDQQPWTNISEGKTPSDSKNYKNFNVDYLPLNFVVNSKREIMAKNIELDSIPSLIEELSKKQIKKLKTNLR